jgi:hypothetical protein
MIAGVPVVGANSGGTAEIIEDGISGLLYPVGDVEELANQLRRLIKDEDFRQMLRKNAIHRARQFSSADKEMEPLLALFPSIRSAPNPSWPLGKLFGTDLSAEFKNSQIMSTRKLGNLLLGKLKRRVKGWIFGA